MERLGHADLSPSRRAGGIMSDPHISSLPSPARRYTPRRLFRLLLLAVLGVAGYVAFQVVPGWIQVVNYSREMALLRRQAGVFFVDALLIAYPVTLIVALLGAVVLVFLRTLARSRGQRHARPDGPGSLLQARLLLLCCSTLLALALFEAGAAAWRSRLNRSPSLPAVGTPPQTAGKGDRLGSDGTPDPGLPVRFQGQEATSNSATRPLRILVIGESSAQGEPYHPWLSVAQIVAWRLDKVFPGRSIEVDMWAVGGAILKTMHQKLDGLTYRPDALMVYVGHNEFQGRYAWMRDVPHYLDEDRVRLGVARRSGVAFILGFSPLYQLLGETREQQRLDALPPRVVTRELVDRPVCTAAELRAIVDDFERRLESIAVYCDSIGTLPIYVIPPCNDAGWDPSRSVLAAETPRAERDAFATEMAHARAVEEKEPAAARQIYRELVNRHPEFAETHFRLARLLEQIGLWDEARDHYNRAREHDGMPLRCNEPLRQAYRNVAARHPSVVLVDGPKVLEARSRHGIVDGQFFHDAQHPNLRGYAALAEDLMNQLRGRRAFSWPEGVPVPVVNAEICARHFGIDARRWAKIATRDLGFWHAAAYIRYDPKFRNRRASEYRRAEAAIRAGRAPADAGIPGWPMPPPISASLWIPERTSGDR
jgi:tetratricopeptide (TPR) repeat protein